MKYCIAFLLISTTALSQKVGLAQLANQFLASLPAELKMKAQYNFDDSERFNWHFVPKSRNGVSFRELNKEQERAALDLLKASVSKQGFEKAMAIRALENVLIEVEHRAATDNYRDPLNYYLTIFGSPATDKPWGWRFEGHHIAMNFTSVNDRIESSTPSFFGSNPGIVMQGADKGKEVLKQETDLGFALVNSFTSEQLNKVLIAEIALPEIVSSNKRTAELLNPTGLSYVNMSTTQKNMLLELLEVYVHNYELGFSHKLMEKINGAGIDKVSFAWAGSLKPGTSNYYRIQGPMLLIEYDNTQNNANHVHTVVRDIANDFGDDILQEHYQKEHKKQ